MITRDEKFENLGRLQNITIYKVDVTWKNNLLLSF